jgi:anti-anti-sigma regulatory factor
MLRGALVGEVDATNRDEVVCEVRSRVGAPGVRAAQLDGSRLTFCDARSLRDLTLVVDEAAARGLPLEITNLAPHLLRLLDLLDGESMRFDHA